MKIDFWNQKKGDYFKSITHKDRNELYLIVNSGKKTENKIKYDNIDTYFFEIKNNNLIVLNASFHNYGGTRSDFYDQFIKPKDVTWLIKAIFEKKFIDSRIHK